MAVSTGNNDKEIREERPAREQRDTRETRDERRDDRHDEPRERTWVAGNSARNTKYRSTGEAGRASTFLKTYVEDNKDNMAEVVSRLLPIDGDIRRDLSNKHGWLIYATPEGEDVMFHVMILEGQKESVDKKILRERREDVTKYTALYDYVSSGVIDKLTKYVERVLKFAGKAIYTGTTIVPAEVNVSEIEEIGSYICAADDANWDVANVDTPFDVNYVKPDATLRLNLSFAPNELAKDVGGLPVRADFMGTVAEVVEGTTKNQLIANDEAETYTGFTAFVSPRYVGADAFERRDDRRSRRDDGEDTRQYVPEVVISSINTIEGPAVGSTERMLLALAAVPFLNTDDRWMRQFEGGLEKNSLRDISALGYGFDPKVITPDRLNADDVEKAMADSRTFTTLMDRLFYCEDGVDVAMIIREGTPGYNVTRILVDAYDNVKPAVARLREALDNITDGGFGAAFRGTNLVADVVRIPTGYYTGRDGEAHPIEEFDTLGVLSRLTDKNPEMIEDWIECTKVGGNSRFDYDARISRMVEILKHVTNNTFVLKGFAFKVYFDPEALKVLHEEVCAGPMALTIDQDGNSTYGSRNRGGGERFALRNNLASRRGRYDPRRGGRDDYRGAGASYRR